MVGICMLTLGSLGLTLMPTHNKSPTKAKENKTSITVDQPLFIQTPFLTKISA
jgi:hypothetical protein